MTYEVGDLVRIKEMRSTYSYGGSLGLIQKLQQMQESDEVCYLIMFSIDERPSFFEEQEIEHV